MSDEGLERSELGKTVKSFWSYFRRVFWQHNHSELQACALPHPYSVGRLPTSLGFRASGLECKGSGPQALEGFRMLGLEPQKQSTLFSLRGKDEARIAGCLVEQRTKLGSDIEANISPHWVLGFRVYDVGVSVKKRKPRKSEGVG